MYSDSALPRDDAIISPVATLCGELGVALSGLREGEKLGEMMGVANVVFRLVNRFDSLPCDLVLRLEKPRRRDTETSFATDS